MSNLITITCGKCGINFGIPENKYDHLKRTGDGWHCPNGHSRVFTETTDDELCKLQERFDAYKSDCERREKQLNWEIRHLRGKSNAFKGLYHRALREKNALKLELSQEN